MPENRFYVNAPLKKQAIITGDELKHLRVMRLNIGDTLELVNGQNQLAEATITALDKKEATLTINSSKSVSPPSRQIILAQALLRPKNLDLVIEKGTELGATAFWLFPSDRAEKTTLSETQLQRLRHLTISALKQCGRLDLPQIQLRPELSKWAPPKGALFFGDLTPNAPRLSPLPSDQIVFIGPEKGFSTEEMLILCNSFNAKGICLAPHILRAETAALSALSQIN